MKDMLREKLSKMESLEERKILRDVVTGVLENIIQYQADSYERLEKRVFEKTQSKQQWDVGMIIRNKDEIDPLDEYFYPIVKEDGLPHIIDSKKIAESIEQNQEIEILDVYMDMPLDQLQKFEKEIKKHIFSGKIETDIREYNIEVKISKNLKYQREIIELHKIFSENGLPWKTINTTYLERFFKIELISGEAISEEEEITKITIDLENYQKYSIYNLVLMWNIERIDLKEGGFPNPAFDKVNYEHVILFENPEEKILIIDENSEIRYIKRSQKHITIISRREKTREWKGLQLKDLRSDKYKNIISNQTQNSFVGNFIEKRDYPIRTKAEIFRIANSYIVSEYLELEDITVQENIIDLDSTYDMNSFIDDEIRLSSKKGMMILKFSAHKENEKYIKDHMSFIVSEIQMNFPEYICRGELS